MDTHFILCYVFLEQFARVFIFHFLLVSFAQFLLLLLLFMHWQFASYTWLVRRVFKNSVFDFVSVSDTRPELYAYLDS